MTDTQSSPDRRFQQVGHRKIGYCGHVPQMVYYDRRDVFEVALHGQKGNIEKRTPCLPNCSRSPVEQAGTCADTEAKAKDQSFLAVLSRPGTQSSSRPLTSDSKHFHPIVGYGGHLPGQQSFCGGRQGNAKLTETLSESNASLTSSSLGATQKFESLPRVPQIRGPTRKAPIGYDVFLTN